MKKILTLAAALSLIATLAVGGSIAYLQDTDEAVNVMTLGSVYIEQHEHQLADDGVTLEPFEQAKDFYPNSTISKIVTVENTGKSDAYFRTLIAFEDIDSDTFEIGFPINEEYTWSWDAPAAAIEVNGVKYEVYEALYKGVLKPGETSPASLTKVEMAAAATNKDMEALGSTYDILVISQAVQTAGFDDAKTALETAFGKTSEKAAEWFGGITVPVTVSNPQELKDAMLVRGAKIVLDDNIVVNADTPLQWGSYMFVANGREVTIDLNGHNIIVEEDAALKTNALFTTANKGAVLNIIGEGTVEVKNGRSGIFHAMNANTQINVYGGTYISNSDNGSNALAIIYTNSGSVDVYGGKFCPLDGITVANAEDLQGNRLSILFHEGTLMKHQKYYEGYDATRIQLEEGCELKEVNIGEETWYQVAKK